MMFLIWKIHSTACLSFNSIGFFFFNVMMVLPSSVKGKSKKYPGEYDGHISEKFTMQERKEVQQRVLLCGSNLEFL